MRKILLFAFLLVAQVYSQSAYISGATSSAVFQTSLSGKYGIIVVTDSSDSYVDTLKVSVYSQTTYGQVGVQDLYTGDYTTLIIPGDGVTRRYLINEPYPTRIRIERTNVSNTTRRTWVWIISKGQ